MVALLLASVWCLLLLGAALQTPLSVTYLVCAGLLVWARPPWRERAPPVALGLALASGFVALPAWLALVATLGAAFGLDPPACTLWAPPRPIDWLASLALAPLFEELLYRERLLPALRSRLGTPLALALSSAAFAAPHLEPWSVLTTFCVGLALGGIQIATGRVGLCVAAHAGLNAAVLACGLPPRRLALAPAAAALVSAGLLAFACAWPRVHAAASGARGGGLGRGTRIAPE